MEIRRVIFIDLGKIGKVFKIFDLMLAEEDTGVPGWRKWMGKQKQRYEEMKLHRKNKKQANKGSQ